jgi:hypothetical protein
MHRLTIPSAAPILLLAMACAPNNAVLTSGEYVAFISADTSSSLLAGDVAFEDWPEKDRWNVDCRAFETLTKKEADALRLPDALDICDRRWPGAIEDAPDHEEWIFQGPFHAVRGDLEPWRGEAVLTSEGDLQIGFHNRLPGGADLRFAFVIDPDMMPTTCAQEDGEVVAEPIDGDWLANWAIELERYIDPASFYEGKNTVETVESSFAHMQKYIDAGGQLWPLNAGSYQVNPENPEENWFFPEEFSAGFAAGKFSEERFVARGARYGEPVVYNLLDADSALGATIPESALWYCDMEQGVDPAEECQPCLSPGSGWGTHCDVIDRATVVENEIYEEFQRLQPDAANPIETLQLRPIVLHNEWRVPDGRPPGLDGWVEMHYNYVVFDPKSNFKEDGNVSGAFTLVFESENTKSRFFVKGEFEVEGIKNDRWTADDLRAIKLEESPDVKNEDALCVSK